MKNKKYILLVIVVILIIIISIFKSQILWFLSPGNAFNAFQNRVCAEDQIEHPLIICGKKVVPLILKDIFNKKMKRRVYAINFIGDIKDYRALPKLILILEDQNEEDYLRWDSFEALMKIDFKLSKTLASNCLIPFKDTKYRNLLDNLKKGIEPKFESARSFIEAWFDKHD